jgi:hypothetical protein
MKTILMLIVGLMLAGCGSIPLLSGERASLSSNGDKLRHTNEHVAIDSLFTVVQRDKTRCFPIPLANKIPYLSAPAGRQRFPRT